MSPVTHFFTGWILANSIAIDRKDRAIVTLACVIPDVDGLGIVGDVLTRHSRHPLHWFSDFHHSLHTLLFALIVSAASFLADQRWRTTLLAFLSFHLHLIEDVFGSRGPDGYQWPVPYLVPFSHAGDLSWHGQWALNAWPNFAITIVLGDDLLSGMVKGIFALRNDLPQSGCGLRCCTTESGPNVLISPEPNSLVNSPTSPAFQSD